jgi:magnesium chelatase family protein
MHVEVLRVPHETLHAPNTNAQASSMVAARVAQVREVQLARQGCANARLLTREIERFCSPTSRARHLLDQASDKFGFSARAYHRILKVARTIADLADAERIDTAHVSEALMLRKLDRS